MLVLESIESEERLLAHLFCKGASGSRLMISSMLSAQGARPQNVSIQTERG